MGRLSATACLCRGTFRETPEDAKPLFRTTASSTPPPPRPPHRAPIYPGSAELPQFERCSVYYLIPGLNSHLPLTFEMTLHQSLAQCLRQSRNLAKGVYSHPTFQVLSWLRSCVFSARDPSPNSISFLPGHFLVTFLDQTLPKGVNSKNHRRIAGKR